MGEVGDGDGVGEEGLADLGDGDVDDNECADSKYDLPTFVAFVQAPRQGSRLSCTCDRIF